MATESAVKSETFIKEIKKFSGAKNIKIYQQAAPLLVPIIEYGEHKWKGTNLILEKYLNPLLSKNIDTLILGCTHYPIIKTQIKNILKKHKKNNIKIISEDEIIPNKLTDYLKQHPEINKQLSKNHKRLYLTTDLNPRIKFLSSLFVGKKIRAKLVDLIRI